MGIESGSTPQIAGVKSPLFSPEGLERDIPTLPTLSEIPHGCASPLPKSRREIKKEIRVKTSHDLKRLLDLVTKQEEKYKERLSPHSNYHLRHCMVQNFLQIQLSTPPNPDQSMQKQTRHRTLFETIVRSFEWRQTTARNIVKWKNLWVYDRIILEQMKENITYSLPSFSKDSFVLCNNLTVRSRIKLVQGHSISQKYINPKNKPAPIIIH